MPQVEPDLPVIQRGRYRHNKSGNFYQVLGVAFHSEEEIPMVIYQPLYESKFEYCVRPYDSFTQMVELDGKLQPRFEYVGE
jgi:hypothetical protein